MDIITNVEKIIDCHKPIVYIVTIMKKSKLLTEVRLIRLSQADHRDIEDTAVKLGLPASEITRRALRIALPILRDLNLPGAPKREEQAQ